MTTASPATENNSPLGKSEVNETEAMAAMVEALKQATSAISPEISLETRMAELEAQCAEYRDQALRKYLGNGRGFNAK